ncbi:MAG: hypothetical protein INR73_17935 [Williamsia sp.]|nr:hypothetical protein [Williamsia sp.]
MEDIEPVDPEYLKGFNEGYIIKQHMPDLADKLASSVGDSLRSQGFKDGRNEVLRERERERYPKWLRSDRLSSLEDKELRSKDRDKDKEDIEPERDR